MSEQQSNSRLAELQTNASNHLLTLEEKGTRSPRVLGFTTIWLSVAIAESDEPVKIIDRIRLADEVLSEEVNHNISSMRDSLDARKVGRRIINRSLPD